MMSAPFRQQIDKESGMLLIIEFRNGLAAHNFERIALLAAYNVDAVGAGACGKLLRNH
jgi:hypothetical protein